jgi:hypothetical protein
VSDFSHFGEENGDRLPDVISRADHRLGSGWTIVRDGDQHDLDAALAVHELAMDGDTVASIEVWASAGAGRLEVISGIELTRGDCLALEMRLIAIAAAES